MNLLRTALETLSGLFFRYLSVSGGSFPRRLTSEEEERYIRLTREGDVSARRLLIEHNLRLVAHVTRKYFVSASDSEDMLSIGTIGLIKAVDSFDPGKGTRFSSFASRCIEKATLSLRLVLLMARKIKPPFQQNGRFSEKSTATCISCIARITVESFSLPCSF